MTQPVVLIDREEAAKVADGWDFGKPIAAEIRQLPPYTAAPARQVCPDCRHSSPNGRSCAQRPNALCDHECVFTAPTTAQPVDEREEFSELIGGPEQFFKKHVKSVSDNPYVRPQPAAPTTEARERAREIVWECFDDVHRFPNAKRICEKLIDRIAAALSSTPSVGDAIAEVKRLRDEWRKSASWEGEEYADGAEIIITALEALQPSTPSEPVYLDCAMCDAPKSFVIDPNDEAVGYCFREKKSWRISIPSEDK